MQVGRECGGLVLNLVSWRYIEGNLKDTSIAVGQRVRASFADAGISVST